MPLDRFVLILVVVIGSAGVTIWLGTMLSLGGAIVLLPAALVGYVAYRVLIERLKNSEDDYYDGIDK